MYVILEAQLLSNITKMSLTYSPLFVDRFGCSFWFCHLEFDKKANYDDGWRTEKAERL